VPNVLEMMDGFIMMISIVTNFVDSMFDAVIAGVEKVTQYFNW
jgi:hypothetical protein